MADCANHPQTAAAAYCRTCGKPLCDACKRDVRGVIYCEECLAARLAGDPAVSAGEVPPVPPVYPMPASTLGTNPVLAAILGFIPGVGAMYNGQFAKALVHVGIFILLIKLTDATNGLFGFGIAAWIFYMAFDAYHTARARQLGLPAPDFLGLNRMFGLREDPRYPAAVPATSTTAAPDEVLPDSRNGVPTGAYWLIGLGTFFLLANLNVFDLRIGRYLWQFVLIGVGLYLAVGRWTGTRAKGGAFCPCLRCRLQNLTGPVMLITVGVLGLLHATRVLRWGDSWPLFLIILGALRLAQVSASVEGHVEYVPPVPPAPPAAPAPPATEPTQTTTGGV